MLNWVVKGMAIAGEMKRGRERNRDSRIEAVAVIDGGGRMWWRRCEIGGEDDSDLNAMARRDSARADVIVRQELRIKKVR
jgi:hypothetical protein